MSKTEKEKLKAIQEKCLSILSVLLKEEDNKYCVDCDAKGPRWASWNLGIFLCIRCAGIHRNLGVHISRVKSVNLDTWTAEQVGSLQQMGNSKGRAVYEANLPDNFRRPSSDSALEVFIRAKYEHKKYIAKEWVPSSAKPAFNTEDIRKKKPEKKKPKTMTPIAKPVTAPVARPKANTNESGSTSPQILESTTQQPKPTTNNDLLGIDVSSKSAVKQDDMFGLFMTGPTETSQANDVTFNQSTVPSDNKESLQPSIAAEEEDFFKQSSDSGGNKKMTKESIMSLFTNSSSGNNQQPAFGMPGGMYVGGQTQAMPPQGPQNGMVMNSAYPPIPSGMMPNPGLMSHPNQMNPALQQQQGVIASNPFMGAAVQPMPTVPGGFASNPNASNNASHMFQTNNPQQQIQSFDANDLIGWSSPHKPFSAPNLANQIQQQMSSMHLSSGQPSQGWNMNGVPGQMMSAPSAMWMPQSQPTVGPMPGQGQTLSNNLWK